MLLKEDTIAAISTPQGTGGIGIVRMSGTDSFKIASEIFVGNKKFATIKSHTVSFGKIVNPVTKEILDEVLITKMEKPKTYTREDVVEISCHGSTVTVRRVLELLIKMGARLAEAGEFTKRAFLNGRIDLSQAEAVIDVINSKTDESSRSAVNQLEGKLSEKIREARKRLIELLAHIEVTVDYPEEDIEEITADKVYEEASVIKGELRKLSLSFERGRFIREGINLVIAGRPNVGKSSLLNELSGKNRAIVSDIPGTTRDIVEDYISINGIPVRVVDTAGIRETEDVIEKIGVQRAKDALKNADLVAVIIDAAGGITEEDKNVLDSVKDLNVIILINKTDIATVEEIKDLKEKFESYEIFEISAKTGHGIEVFEEKIASMVRTGKLSGESEILVTNVRHKILIDRAVESIDEALKAYDLGMPLDCLSIDIKNSAEYLGNIIGESVTDDVLKEVFSRFCLGK